MVLDKLINPQLLRSKPVLALPTGFFFVVLAFFSTSFVFQAEYSIIVVAFASMLILPYVIKIFELDELNVDLSQVGFSDSMSGEELSSWVRKCLRDGFTPEQIKKSLIENNIDRNVGLLKDLGVLDEIQGDYVRKSNFLSRHVRSVNFYYNLFLGMFLAFMAFYIFSGDMLRPVFFEHQINLIYGAAGNFSLPSAFTRILANNMRIVFLCMFLSLFYGAGAILILTYNASIAGVLYGGFIKNNLLGESARLVLAYMPHTTLEIIAYLYAAIAGGILSKSIMESEPGSSRLLRGDGLKFFLISVVFVLLAAAVEVTLPKALLS